MDDWWAQIPKGYVPMCINLAFSVWCATNLWVGLRRGEARFYRVSGSRSASPLRYWGLMTFWAFYAVASATAAAVMVVTGKATQAVQF